MAKFRIGKISRIDYKAGKVAVMFPDQDDAVTDLLPFLAFGGEYHMPKPGQYVAVAHLSTGEEMGIVLGAFWSESNPPAAWGKDIFRKEMSNEPGRAFLQHAPDSGTLTIKADKIELQTDSGTVTVAEIIAAIRSIREV